MTLDEVHAELAELCGQAAKLFAPGARISIVVRNPNHGKDGSADLFVSDDDPDAVIKSLEYLKGRLERKLAQ
jgi:hypothetical protein